MNPRELWQRYQKYLCQVPRCGISIDISRMNFDERFLARMREPMAAALAAMSRIESGDRANFDENRMVGHYWLRNSSLAPDEGIRRDIDKCTAAIRNFSEGVESGTVRPQKSDLFEVLLCIGIGGSSLGPQLVSDALGNLSDTMVVRFIDNTDPDGITRILDELEDSLDSTLTIVTSKSGGTAETRNGMLEAAAAYHRRGLAFPKHAVAITQEGSELHEQAINEHWLATFPMWDWVGGRTSVTAAAGLLPAALQGLDISALLQGARACDEATREPDMMRNPAALLALMWYFAGNGRGEKNMVVLPYCDRLQLLGKYLQQLVMESIGKERDRKGNIVHHGLTVFGNKGSTDQHSFVQQLREGRNDFFVNFVEVLAEPHQPDPSPTVPTTGDYLHGFLRGTRMALMENGRESITLTLDHIDARRLGAIIALYERTVGLYAELIDVNAYHQPGVEAGKKAANGLLELHGKVIAYLNKTRESSWTAQEIADAIGNPERVEDVFHFLMRDSANRRIQRHDGPEIGQTRFQI